MENTQLEEMTSIIQNTWLPIMRGYDTVGETRLSERDASRIANQLIEAKYVKQREAEWLRGKDGLFVCSVCNKTCPYDASADDILYWECKFCPNCGAEMNREDKL